MVRTSRAAKVAWMVAWLIVFYLVARVVSAHAGEVPPAEAQAFQQVFQKVAPSVVAIRAQGRDAMSGSQTRIIERGSGVLISRTAWCSPRPTWCTAWMRSPWSSRAA